MNYYPSRTFLNLLVISSELFVDIWQVDVDVHAGEQRNWSNGK